VTSAEEEGVFLAALVIAGVIAIAIAVGAAVSRPLRQTLRERLGGPRAMSLLLVPAAALVLTTIGVYRDGSGGEAGRPIAFYVLAWILIGTPILLAHGIWATWARRTRPREWAEISSGRTPQALSRAMRRAFYFSLLGVVPAGLIVWFLFYWPAEMVPNSVKPKGLTRSHTAHYPPGIVRAMSRYRFWANLTQGGARSHVSTG
jgi:hypothetical protein